MTFLVFIRGFYYHIICNSYVKQVDQKKRLTKKANKTFYFFLSRRVSSRRNLDVLCRLFLSVAVAPIINRNLNKSHTSFGRSFRLAATRSLRDTIEIAPVINLSVLLLHRLHFEIAESDAMSKLANASDSALHFANVDS